MSSRSLSFVRGGAGLLALALLLAACAGTGPLAHEAQRYAGFDACHRTITTTSPEAQQWFDQGLTFLYGFNHDEAVRSFHRATEADPGCAMAYWGLAVASGKDINNGEIGAAEAQIGYDAAQKALALSEGAVTPVERALCRAIATRYAWPAPADRAALDEAYTAAMEGVFEAHPDDPDVAVHFAESLMLLQPWDYWTSDGAPKMRILDAVAALERALDVDPRHAGACHYYIHAVEASKDPGRAERAADVLLELVPASGHLVHMPSHVYVRVGRYADAADSNMRAIAADQAYFERAPEKGFYILYYAHNQHMLAFSAMMEGREAVALEAARALGRDVTDDLLRPMVSFMDGIMATPLHVLVRFGRWEDVLAEPQPPAWRLLSRAQWHYARGVALSALGRTGEARAEQTAFEAAVAEVPSDWKMGNNEAASILQIERKMLAGEILWREGDRDGAFAALAEAARLEDELVYDEPPGWMQPVRHAYGALLMAAGRHAEAEAVYRDDLLRHPANGWSLLGLQQSLAAQQKDGEAATVAQQLAAAWGRADVVSRTRSSCFCEPGPAADA